MRLFIPTVSLALLLGACTTASDPPLRLVVVDEGNVVTIAADGTDLFTVAETDRGSFFQPVWSPDGNLLAFSLNATEPAMLVSTPDGTNVQTTTTDSMPFYFSWSTTNQLATLRSGDAGLRLDTAPAESLDDLSTVATGQPLYYSWNPDGLELVAHIGPDQLVVSDLTESTSLGVNPGSFQAPRWTEQGIIAVEADTQDQRLTLVARDGASMPIATLGGPGTFVPNRDGSLIALQSLATGQNGTSAAFQQIPRLPTNRLVVVDADSGEYQTVTNDIALAYFWSPADDQLLVLDIVPGPQARWSVWADGEVTEMVRFEPDPSFLSEFVPFFDQYAQSASLWAPDGSAFAFPGAIDGDPGVWVHPVDGDAERISGGNWVSWAP